MDDDLPSVISGTRRKAQELADGTLRVMVDIDPRFKAEFHQLFPNIDTPCALAPLVANFERIEEEEKQKGGPLCRLACIWCKDEDFWKWLIDSGNLHRCDSEEYAADWIRAMCGVESRAEIDSNPFAAEMFMRSVRAPFMEWSKNN